MSSFDCLTLSTSVRRRLASFVVLENRSNLRSVRFDRPKNCLTWHRCEIDRSNHWRVSPHLYSVHWSSCESLMRAEIIEVECRSVLDRLPSLVANYRSAVFYNRWFSDWSLGHSFGSSRSFESWMKKIPSKSFAGGIERNLTNCPTLLLAFIWN